MAQKCLNSLFLPLFYPHTSSHCVLAFDHIFDPNACANIIIFIMAHGLHLSSPRLPLWLFISAVWIFNAVISACVSGRASETVCSASGVCCPWAKSLKVWHWWGGFLHMRTETSPGSPIQMDTLWMERYHLSQFNLLNTQPQLHSFTVICCSQPGCHRTAGESRKTVWWLLSICAPVMDISFISQWTS